MSDFLLLSFENIAASLELLSKAGTPFLHLCPYQYMSVDLTVVPPHGEILVVTSARCFKFYPSLEFWRHRRLFVVGKGTEAAALALGLKPEFVGHSGGAEVVQAAQMAGQHIFHLGGTELSEPLQKALETVEHTRIPLYTRQQNVRFTDSKERIALSAIASPAAAHAIGRHDVFSNAPCVCIGQTTAKAAAAAGLRVLGVAEQPRFVALTALAISAYNHCSRRSL